MKNPLSKIEAFEKLGMKVVEDGVEGVALEMPLDGNTNDKGTMFAGSLYSLMVLAGWKLAINVSENNDCFGNAVIREASINYLRPVPDDCVARAELKKDFYLNLYGNGCCDIVVRIHNEQGRVCVEFDGQYRVVKDK